jgi:N-acetylglucosaminyl-diphospho-decaprenol L-rhamnosyltransferase
MKMNLTIIMVNYKCDKNKLNACLKSINIKVKVLIVDHSHDLKEDQIDIPNNISLEIIKNKNLGNGAGINYGLENAKTKYVLYLDIDTILSDNFFIKLENAVNAVQEFAVIAPKINDFYDDIKIKNYGNLSISRFFYNKFFYKIKKETKLPENINHVFFVSGSIMLINKELILNKNIKFDENIFMFFEEDDFFHQCFKLNLKIFLIDNMEATHLDGSVLDNTLNYECFKKWHWEWSKYYFLNKHYNKILIFFLALKNLIKFYVKIIFYYFLDKKKLKIFQSRIAGLISFYIKGSKKII